MGSCCGGINLVAGTPIVVDPAACNALTNGPSGLLVPSVDLLIDNSAAQPPTSATRSIDLDLIEAGGCPNSFTIGARLSPRFGQTEMAATVVSGSPASTYVNVPGTIVLPEAGTYEVTSRARAFCSPAVGAPDNVYIVGRLFNVTAGAPVPLSEILIADGSVGPTDVCQNTGSTTTFITVAVPTTIRYQVQWLGATPSAGTGITSDANGRSMLAFKKVAD